MKVQPLASGQDNSELCHILQRPLLDPSEVTLRGTLPEVTSSPDFLLSLPASPLPCRSPFGGFLNEPLTQEPLSQGLLLRSPLRQYLTRVRDGTSLPSRFWAPPVRPVQFTPLGSDSIPLALTSSRGRSGVAHKTLSTQVVQVCRKIMVKVDCDHLRGTSWMIWADT